MQHPEKTPGQTTGLMSKRSRWLAGIAAAGALATLFAVTPQAFAHPEDGVSCGMTHAGHHGPGHMDARHMEKMVDRVFAKAGASDEQKKRAQDIVRAASVEMKALQPAGDSDGPKEMLALLSADKIDRARIEQHRVAHHALADRMSKVMTRTMADLAEVLAPEQRRAAAKELEQQMGDDHHGRHGGMRPPRDDAPKR